MGYKYNQSVAYCTKAIGNRGNDQEWDNPLVSDMDHVQKIADWLALYYESPVEYDLDFRGEPALDVGDTIFQENRYNDKQKTIIEESQLKFEQSITGALKKRRKQNEKDKIIKNYVASSLRFDACGGIISNKRMR